MLGRTIIIIGCLIIVIGIIIYFFDKIPFLGKLPGDLVIKRENFTIYIPITTCIIFSILFSLILYLLDK
mgnify:CR=1 FL=1